MNISFSRKVWRRAIVAGLFAAGLVSPMASASAQDGAGDVSGKVTELVDSVVTAEVELEVQQRRSKILRMKQDIFRTAVADPEILEFVAFGTREIELIGQTRGSTTVTLWMGDEQAPQILSMLVRVVPDPTLEQDDRSEFSELADRINEMFPDSRIQLIPIADKLIVRGDARDEAEAKQIMAVVGQNAGGGGGLGGQQLFASNGRPARLYESTRVVQHDFQIVDLIHVSGVKQVMLKVRIAELTRTAGRALGAQLNNFRFSDSTGGSTGTNLATAIAPGTASLSGMFDHIQFDAALQAQVSHGNAKILAEPNLVTLSGQSATFLSGGEFAVPTVVGVGGAQAATTSFKNFGTSLNFTPTVLDNDRIRLQVSPTFSTTQDGIIVQGIPGLTTRTVTTTVEMREGQVFAIAGLLQDQQSGAITKFPLLGDVPGLNVLTANRDVSRSETELLILVTPELVQPLEPEEAPTLLPGMEVTEPNDLDLFVFGDIEGRPRAHHRSTVWSLYKNRLKRCYECDKSHKSSKFFLKGLHGFAD
ncbi:MAG: type II and III secretion system protein family protein [Planctomycetota bacterium]|jgi:pilus assembly protein CpaC